MKIKLFFASLIVLISFILVFKYNIISNYFSDRLKDFQVIIIILVSLSALYTYIQNADKELKLERQRYMDTIIEDFIKIDDYLRSDYDNLKHIFRIVYNKLQLPTSNIEKIEYILDKLPNKEKDLTFLLFNKITYLCEKIYLTDQTLFDNDKLGLKIRLYLENELYYQYWQINKVIYDSSFINFMETRFKFLQLTDIRFNQMDDTIYKIPASNKNNFMFV